jgi:hypothetical protein
LIDAVVRARAAYEQSVRELVPLLTLISIEALAEVLPGAHALAVRGEVNEDWLPILRIQRVLDADGAVLFDADVGHDVPSVEELIDEVNVEYLDLLLDVTGDEFMGSKMLHRAPRSGPAPGSAI